MDGWRDCRGRSKGFEVARGRGEYSFKSLMTPNNKGTNGAVLYCVANITLFIYGRWCVCAHRIAWLRFGRWSRASKTVLGTIPMRRPDWNSFVCRETKHVLAAGSLRSRQITFLPMNCILRHVWQWWTRHHPSQVPTTLIDHCTPFWLHVHVVLFSSQETRISPHWSCDLWRTPCHALTQVFHLTLTIWDGSLPSKQTRSGLLPTVQLPSVGVSSLHSAHSRRHKLVLLIVNLTVNNSSPLLRHYKRSFALSVWTMCLPLREICTWITWVTSRLFLGGGPPSWSTFTVGSGTGWSDKVDPDEVLLDFCGCWRWM